MSLPIIVATLAPIVNSIQLFPQLHKTYVTKSVQDLSIYSLVLMLSTNLLWFFHGYFIADASLLLSTIVALIVNATLFILYLSYTDIKIR